MRKWIAGALSMLVLLSVLALSGCGETDPQLIGTWSTTVDLTEAINQDFNQEGDDMAGYIQIDQLQFETRYTFREDGTFENTAVESSVDAAFAKLKEEVRAGLEQYFSDKAKEENLDMTVDALLREAGTSLDEMVEGIFSEANLEAYTGSMASEGRYKYADGKLYTTTGEDGAIDETSYITCEFTSGTELKLLEPFGEGSEAVKSSYPITLKKVDAD